MRLLLLAPHSHIRTPLSKHTPLLADALRELGCRVRVEAWGRHREREGWSDKVLGRAADIRRVRHVLRDEPADMLIIKTAHDWSTLGRDIALLMATRGLGARQVLQLHGSWVDRLIAPGHSAFKLASAALVRLCDAMLVLSREEQTQWQSFSPSTRIFAVKNPLGALVSSPAPTHLPNPDPVPVILFVGRLIEVKGLTDLFDALALVLERTAFRLIIAGEGPMRPELQRRVATLGLAAHVTFAGYLEADDLQHAYAAAHVFVLPSRNEGFPYSVLEAMRAGLPVVTTRIRGVVDHLEEGRHALLTQPRDVSGLARALQTLLADPQLRARMAQANREKVREFAPDVVGREYLAVLREINGTSALRGSASSDGS